ncbi:MAG: Ig-like domain-containing protein [Steroidobacteraceae bacterium]
MNIRSFAALLWISASMIPGIASATHSTRIDNPGAPCAILHWGTIVEDPYMVLDGNNTDTETSANFFVPGTVTTGDKVAVCTPKEPLSKIWATDGFADAPNPASNPDPDTGLPTIPDQTAKTAVMYDWENEGTSPPLNFTLAPDAEVIVWVIAPGKAFGSGAFELELDNWCSPSPAFTSGTQTPPNTTASIHWNGNLYTAECANFNSTSNPSASDLLLNRSGVLIGYVDQNNATQVTTTVPGWTISLRTGTTLAISPNPVTANSPVAFEAVVAGLIGASTPAGTVTFNNGTTALGAGTLDAAGVAHFNSAGLASGTYSITASYGGDSTHAISKSAAQSLTVE